MEIFIHLCSYQTILSFIQKLPLPAVLTQDTPVTFCVESGLAVCLLQA